MKHGWFPFNEVKSENINRLLESKYDCTLDTDDITAKAFEFISI